MDVQVHPSCEVGAIEKVVPVAWKGGPRNDMSARLQWIGGDDGNDIQSWGSLATGGDGERGQGDSQE